MNVELQILKHLQRDARPTVSGIDQYCSALNQYQLSWLVSIRSNQRVRANKWSTVPWRLPPGLAVDRLPRCKFTRTFSNQNSETRYIREIIYGKRHRITYWQLTTDTETMPENSTTYSS